jgi:hypothetical protein
VALTLTLTLVIPLLVLMRSSGMREERETSPAQSTATNTGRAAPQESRLVISPR